MFDKLRFTPRKKQLRLLIALLVCAVGIMVFILKSSHHARRTRPAFSSSYVRAGGDTLNIAIEMNPAVYMVRGDSVSGRDYDMIMKMSKHSGHPVKFFPFVPLQVAIDGLEDGTFDVLVASMPLTTDLKQRFLMTRQVYLDREILVQLSGNPVRSQIDLGGDTVWITSESPFLERLSNMSDEIGDTIYIKSSPDFSAEALFILVAKGIIKYAAINEGIARQLVESYPQVDIDTPISFTQFQSWALRKDNTSLCDSINTWLSEISDDTNQI